MSFKLTIKQTTDPQLLQLFHNDTFADFTVITTHQKLHLALAYLAIDSDYFGRIAPGVKQVDLSSTNQVYLIAVLRSVYGDKLQASSISELIQIFIVVSFLEIKQYIVLLEKAIVNLHKQQGNISELFSIELLQFSMKNGLAKDLILRLHIQDRLKSLQSIRNYLQLSKLSKQHLNCLLLQLLRQEGEKSYQIINRVLQNYFNRKAYRVSDYFQDQNLLPLKAVWQHFHHKITFSNQNMVLSKSCPQKLTRPSDRRTSIKLGMNKPISLPNINEEPLQYDPKLLRSEKMDEERLLDIKISSLQKQKREKDLKICQLRKKIMQLRALNQLTAQNQQQSFIQDFCVSHQVARSRKLRQKLLQKERSGVEGEEGLWLLKMNSEKKLKSSVDVT